MGVCNQAICGPQHMKKRKEKKTEIKIDIPRVLGIYIFIIPTYIGIVKLYLPS